MPNSSLAVLILIALAAGYYFASNYERTSWRVKRSEGRRLFFESANAAVWLSIGSFLLFFIPFHCIFRQIKEPRPAWLETLLNDPFILSLAGSFLFARLALFRMNYQYKKRGNPGEIIDQYGSEFEKMLSQSFLNSVPIAITLENKKYYVGWLAKSPEITDVDEGYLRILPALSGYRHNETLKPVFNVSYLNIYERIEQGDPELEKQLAGTSFEIVIPIEQIVSIYQYSLGIDPVLFQIDDSVT